MKPENFSQFNRYYSGITEILTGSKNQIDERTFRRITNAETDLERTNIAEHELWFGLDIILQKLFCSLERLTEKYPNFLMEIFQDVVEALERIKEIRDVEHSTLAYSLYYDVKGRLDELERIIRRITSPVEVFQADGRGTIQLGTLNISERCCAGCDHCGVDAKPDGNLMELEMLLGILASKKTGIKENRIYLGDGEVLLHPRILDIIKTLVGCGYKVGFTTAGLIPVNRKYGIEALKSLKGLGPYLSDVLVTVSFSFFHIELTN